MKRIVALVPAIAVLFALSACDAGTSEPGSSETATGGGGSSTQAAETPTSWYASYGTFTPIQKSGNSDAVVPLPAGVKAAIVTSTYKGQDNFSITALDAENQPTGDLLVNAIGSYSGTSAFGFSSFSEAKTLQVQGSGAWTLSIKPVTSAPVLTVPAQGKGDAVFRYDGPAGAVKLTHNGESNFIVDQYAKGADMPGMSVNEIGAYSGEVPSLKGPSVVIIQADGNWTIAK